jgi:DNA polymerase-3 subunit gamma/tau
MLLKGITEAEEAARPLAAADMVLVRIAHAADLPTPDEALRQLRESGAGDPEPRRSAPAESGAPRASAGPVPSLATRTASAARPAPAPQPQASAAPTVRLETFADLVAHAGAERELKLKHALEQNVRVIRYEPGRIEIRFAGDAPSGFIAELGRKLQEWTGTRWVISIGSGDAAPTLHEQREANRARMVTDARSDPLVAEVLSRFPGAEIVDVRVRGGGETPPFAPDTDFQPDALPDDTGDDE